MRSLLLLAGILIALWAPARQQVWLVWCLPVLLAVLPWWRRTRWLWWAAGGAACAVCATGQLRVPHDLVAGERLLVQARILGVPGLDESGWRFDARITFPRHPDWPAQRWRLRAPSGLDGPATGELWQYAIRFDPPRDAAGRRSLWRDRVCAQASIVAGSLNHRLSVAGPSLDGLRERLARRIADRVADPAAASLLPALAVGVTGEVSARQWQVFSSTGISHLVAISGMHVTFFAMMCMAVARRAWGVLASLPRVPRRERLVAVTGVVMALLYALLSGFGVPAQRTVVMLTAWLALRECDRRCRPDWSIAAALMAVLVFDPMAALSAGFWLSFIAVAVIIMVEGSRVGAAAPLRAGMRVQWLMTVALLPVTVLLFGSFSAVGLLANVMAIPVFTVLLVPLVLLATACFLLPGAAAAWCGNGLVDLAALVAQWCWPPLSWCANQSWGQWRVEAPVTWLLVAVLAVPLALLPWSRGWRPLALLLLALVFLLRDPRPAAGELWIDVPDGGRSGAVLLRTRGHLYLWGTSESYGARGRAFSRHVLPLLRASGYSAIDLWLPGSLSRDAQAALAVGAAAIPVRRVLLPPARAAPPEMHSCAAAQWLQDGISFHLGPSTDDRTCLLRAVAGGIDLRLGGADATPFVNSGSETLQLVMDGRGIRLRRRDLRL